MSTKPTDVPLGRMKRIDATRLVFAGLRESDPGTFYLAHRDDSGRDHRVRLSTEALAALQLLFHNPDNGEPLRVRIDTSLAEGRMIQLSDGRRVILARACYKTPLMAEAQPWSAVWFHDGKGGTTEFSMPERCLGTMLDIAKALPARLAKPYPPPPEPPMEWVAVSLKAPA